MILDPDLRIGYFEYLISAEYYYEATYKMFLSNFSNITSKSFYNFKNLSKIFKEDILEIVAGFP